MYYSFFSYFCNAFSFWFSFCDQFQRAISECHGGESSQAFPDDHRTRIAEISVAKEKGSLTSDLPLQVRSCLSGLREDDPMLPSEYKIAG